MSDATKKNFAIIQNVLNEQAAVIRALQERISHLEGNLAETKADIVNTKQLIGHISGRGMGSTVYK